jgi:TonB family protein
MIKLLLITILGFIIYNSAAAQLNTRKQSDSVAYYMRDDYAMANSQSNARFLRLIIKADSGLYEIQDYFPDGKPRLLAKSYQGRMVFQMGRQGLYTEYFTNGNIRYKRHYNKGKLVGEAIAYYPNGNVYSIVNYDGNEYYLKSCRDTLGEILADGGNGKWIKLNDTLAYIAEGPVVNGKEDGEWNGVNDDGKNATAVYKNGIAISGPPLNGSMVNQVFTAVQVPPQFDTSAKDLQEYIRKNLVYPQVALDNNIQGTVILTFVVEKDGSLTNFKVLRGIGSGMDESAIRLMENCPKWNPGRQNGKPVRVQYSIPVKFDLAEHKKF